MIGVQASEIHVANGATCASSQLSGTRLWNSPFLTREEQSALDKAILPPRSVAPKTDLLREGGRVDGVFIVTDGWACRYATTREGGRQLSALLVPGDVANLDALMFERSDEGMRTLTEVDVAVLPRDRAIALAEQHPGIARTFTGLAMVENAILRRWALSLGRKSSIERLSHLLCEMSVRLGAEDGNQSSFVFPVTQEQIGDALGLTSVHVNRTMRQLRSEGLVVTADGVMRLLDVPALRRLGGFDPSYLHADASLRRLPA